MGAGWCSLHGLVNVKKANEWNPIQNGLGAQDGKQVVPPKERSINCIHFPSTQMSPRLTRLDIVKADFFWSMPVQDRSINSSKPQQ